MKQKHPNVLNIILESLMYLSQLFFVAVLLVMKYGPVSADTPILILFIFGVVIGSFGLIISIVTAVVALVNIFSSSFSSPVKSTMIMKLSLIPWYLTNFFLWFLVVGGFCNPWLFVGIPLIIGLGVSSTFIFMIATSFLDFAYLISLGKDQRLQNSSVIVVAIVFLFFFVLDTVGATMLFFAERKGHLVKEKKPLTV